MKKIGLKCFGLLCLFPGFLNTAFCQDIVVVQTRHIPPENIEEFIHRETTYWSKVAQKAIDEGKLSAWSLWQRVDGFDVDKDHNFFFVNEYTQEQFGQEGSIWDYKKVFPDMKRSDISTFELGTVQDVLFYRNHVFIQTAPAQYIRVNFAKASDMNRYLELETTVWQPFIREQMQAEKTTVVSWILSSLIYPGGADLPHNAVTVDGYATLKDAVGQSYDEGVEFPDFSEFQKVHQKAEIHLYRRVASVGTQGE